MIALAEIEATGIRVDERRLDATTEMAKERMRRIEDKLRQDEVWEIWQRRFGTKANLHSDDQLRDVLYGEMKFPVTQWTGDEEGEGQPSVEIGALEKIDLHFLRGYQILSQLNKAHGTYLKRIKRTLVNGRFHPNYDLHTTVTYRSSSDFQNVPVRDPMQAELLRTNFIATDQNYVLVENDFKGAEVSIATCYHRDPVMISYLTDPTKDMHGDMSAQIYFLKNEWVKKYGKNHRYGGKNRFVFPEFYGSYYKQCAPDLWEWMERAKLLGPDGRPLREHLRANGIFELGACDPKAKGGPLDGTFEKHIQEVEDDFWNNRFKVYSAWKKKWYEDYLEEGGFDTLTGFRIEGAFRRNQVINYPVQGSAFHCLLWTLTRLNKLLRKHKMKSRVVMQVHDSMLGDVYIKELKQYLDLVHQVVNEDLRKAFKWIICPLEVEDEICPPTGTWFHKYPFKWDGIEFGFTPKGKDDKVNTEDVEQFLEMLEHNMKPS